MPHLAGFSVTPANDVVDLTNDSDDDSLPEIQAVVPVVPLIKHEQDEQHNEIAHHNSDLNNTAFVEPVIETTDDELVEPKDDHKDVRGSEANDETIDVKPLSSTANQHQSPKNSLAMEQSIGVNLVDTLDLGPIAHFDAAHLHAAPTAPTDPFDDYPPKEPLETLDFGGLPELFPLPDEELDMHGLEALRQYNQNKSDFNDDCSVVKESARNYAEQSNMAVVEKTDEMDWNAVLDEDSSAANESAAAAFAVRKKEHERKAEEGLNTTEDNIRFAADEVAEHRRLRDIARSKMVVKETPEQNGIPAGYEEADSLFVPEVPELPGSKPKKRAAPKSRNYLSKKELQDAISAGIDAGFGEGRKPKRKAATDSEDRQPKKKRETKKDGGPPKSVQRRGRKQRPNLSNIQSLGRINIVDAAQANASRPDMPTFTSSNKAKALQELIASIPSAERGTASSDRAAVLEATKKFNGRRAIRSDNHGGWRLRGMESSLYNHQLLGAAFMRERETGDLKPKGGLVCDEMGFGKTIQMIANILDGKADEGSAVKTTLIIAPPALLNQWMQEMDKHVSGSALGRILRYHSGSRLHSNNIVADLTAYDVILTTYSEVQKSYPLAEPPKHLASDDRKNEWWKNYFLNNVGPLHQIKFHRIVLDEAHHIKSHTSKTSIAVRALTGNYRWCITGTPILNYIEELFSYFSFLKVPHTGDYGTFCHNYCNNRVNKEPVHMGRIHNILRAIMLRRTHVDTLFNAPIVKLPGITHNTVTVEFNPVERNIYNMVKSRYIQQINTYSKSGTLNSNYSNILGMLVRLRMLCSHIMLCQDVMKRMFVAADIEALWRLTAKEVQASQDTASMNMMKALRKMLAANENTLKTCQTKELEATHCKTPDIEGDANMETGSTYGLSFKFRKFLRSLTTSETWTEVHLRSVCAKCRLPPDEPVCTSCFHVYCQECIIAMHEERKASGEEKTACLECQTLFEETSPCAGLKELGFNTREMAAKVEKKKKKMARLTQKAKGMRSASLNRGSTVSEENSEDDEEEDQDWLELGGALLPSAKLAATKAAILNWKEQYQGQKIIVYTQFLGLGQIFSNVCSAEGWGHVLFNGKMTIEARERAIDKFRDDPNIFIMICSLKAGGVGLNLSMASKVIILDLWFNSSIEAQAYCRAFRIGQEKRVDVLRFVVKDSIDEDLIKMQDRKDVEVTSAIGPDSMGKRATIQQLLELFGEVKEQGQNEFILVEDENEGKGDEDDDDDVDLTNRLPPRPF
ncbi:SNF2 family domain-containing protein [Cladophialophora immunda]|nr:SNF2 family domain-containing protein [Cladophialophora immunda]